MKLFGQYNIFNPPAYYQQAATDPTQIPIQYLPYGTGGALTPYGPWYGFYLGQRIIGPEEAERLAKDRQRAMERKSRTTDDPTYKYLTPGGRLSPKAKKAMDLFEVISQQEQQKINQRKPGKLKQMIIELLNE